MVAKRSSCHKFCWVFIIYDPLSLFSIVWEALDELNTFSIPTATPAEAIVATTTPIDFYELFIQLNSNKSYLAQPNK